MDSNITPRKKLKILFTEGSSLTARQNLYVLGGKHSIDIMDPSPICQCRLSRYVRRFHRCPHYSEDPEAYLNFLVRLLRKENYDILIPTHEQVYLVSKAQEDISRYVHCALPPFQALQRIEGKYEFLELLKELGLPCPAYTSVNSKDEFLAHDSFPCWVKLSYGTASQTVWPVQNFEDLKSLADKLESTARFDDPDNKIILQAPGKGVLSVTNAIFQSGTLLAGHSFKTIRQGYAGMATIKESVHHPVVMEHIKTIGKHVGWNGPLFIDYLYDEEKKRPEYIEANTRIGEIFNAFRSGIDLPDLYLQVALNKPVQNQMVPPGLPGQRSHNGYMVLATIASHGGGRLGILKELWRMLRSSGPFLNSEEEITKPGKDPSSLIIFLLFLIQMLIWPKLAVMNIRRTIKNYSLSRDTMKKIAGFSKEQIGGCMNQIGSSGVFS